MDKLTTMVEPPRGVAFAEMAPTRVVCAACGAGQALPRKGRSALCLICGKPLSVAEPDAVVALDRIDDAAAKRPLIAEAKKILAGREEQPFSCEDLDDVLANERRMLSMLSVIPVWGIWQLSRSTLHSDAQKLGLALVSIAITLLLAVGVWSIVPGAREHTAAEHARIDASLQQLSQLIRDYTREHGSLPDAGTWQRSADGGDLRFYDPWGRPFRYELGEAEARLGTYGKDGVDGGDGEDSDSFVTVAAPAVVAAQGDRAR